MTGQDFQDRLAALVTDLQTNGKGQTVNVMFRGAGNTPQVFPLSSDAGGNVNAGQLAAINAWLAENDILTTANGYAESSVPVTAAREAFKQAQAPHEALMTAATNARKALTDALEADPAYQAAKQTLETAQANEEYVTFRDAYARLNVSENYAELSSAKGKYVVA